MYVRLPTQAGKVSKMVTTNLVAKGPSWIAKGDKYYSLCVPNRSMVACAPIVATSVMKGIEVGALAGTKGEPLLTFKMDPGMPPTLAVHAINYFHARINKQKAHFNRMAVSYAPTPQQTSLRVGQTSNFADTGGGGGCSYDDEGSYACTGGSSTGGSGSTGGSEPTGQCDGDCNYPSGNNNGNQDPCIDPNGNRICDSSSEIPQVIITGQVPTTELPTSLPTCVPSGPFTTTCRIPPVIGGGFEQLPKGPVPWFPQSWCNLLSVFCSAGQTPEESDWDRGNDFTLSGKTLEQIAELCDKQYENDFDTCKAMKGAFGDTRSYDQCFRKAADRNTACLRTAREVTDHGKHVAP